MPKRLPSRPAFSRRRTNMILLAAGALATAGFATAALSGGSGPAAFAVPVERPVAQSDALPTAAAESSATAATSATSAAASAGTEPAEGIVLAAPRTAPVAPQHRWQVQDFALLGAAIAATAATCGVAFGRSRGERAERAETARIDLPASPQLV